MEFLFEENRWFWLVEDKTAQHPFHKGFKKVITPKLDNCFCPLYSIDFHFISDFRVFSPPLFCLARTNRGESDI